jgi:hypothetical protein
VFKKKISNWLLTLLHYCTTPVRVSKYKKQKTLLKKIPYIYPSSRCSSKTARLLKKQKKPGRSRACVVLRCGEYYVLFPETLIFPCFM